MSDRPPFTPLLPEGKVIGGCRIIRGIGKGGMGVVYLAEHLALRQPRAIKVLPTSWASDSKKKRFLREARACASIIHPNVVTIHDVGEEDGLSFIVMQYVDGSDLSTLLKEHEAALPWRSAVRIIQGAADGLKAVHQHGLIHRDIKPGNIMLSKDDRVLLMDFGLVRGADEEMLTESGVIVGTPAFMSPEQCRGEKLGPASDVYSLAATLYFLLSGRLPFGNSNAPIQIAAGMTPPALHTIRHQVPLALSNIVARAMAPQVSNRIVDAAEFSAALGRLLRSGDSIRRAPDDALPSAPSLQEVIPALQVDDVVRDEPSVGRRADVWDSVQSSIAAHKPWVAAWTVSVVILLLLLISNLSSRGQRAVANARVAVQADLTGMVRIPAGRVHMGNSRLAVKQHLENAVGKILAGLASSPELKSQLQERFADPDTRQQIQRLFDTLLDQCLESETDVDLGEFWIDAFEVTNAQYAVFIKETGYEAPEHWSGTAPPAGSADHPVTHIRYRDAEVYARWRGAQLPTAEQWTRAYRGASQTMFPWGDAYSELRANTMENTSGATTPVSATQEDRSPLGVFNLVGNVAEFVRGRTTVQGQPAVFFKGGSYMSTGVGDGLGCIRQPASSATGHPAIGFRCVVEANAAPRESKESARPGS